MIIKFNLKGVPSIKLKVSSNLNQQLHVIRKKDEFGRRLTTSWITTNTEVTLERYHSNENCKDVDGLVYVGRSYQQYMDPFDKAYGFRLAGVRALAKFFKTECDKNVDATKLAEDVMQVILANKRKEKVTVNADTIASALLKPTKAKAKDKTKAVETAPSKKRGRPAKAEKAEAKSVASPARKRGRPRKQPS